MEVSDNPALQKDTSDPTLLCTAYKKNRFYLFSRRDPEELKGSESTACTGHLFNHLSFSPSLLPLPPLLCRVDADRDLFNEKPSKEEMMAATQVNLKVLPLSCSFLPGDKFCTTTCSILSRLVHHEWVTWLSSTRAWETFTSSSFLSSESWACMASWWAGWSHLWVVCSASTLSW